MLDAKLLTALLFIILSITTIFAVRNRTSIITTLIIAHLVVILFLSLIITNYDSFKEIVLTLIAYLMLLVFLIVNHKSNENFSRSTAFKFNISHLKFIKHIFIALVIFFATFSLAKSTIKSLSLNNQNTQLAAQNFVAFDAKERKKQRLKKKLENNFLLKRSSDVILIIVAVSSAILILRNKKEI